MRYYLKYIIIVIVVAILFAIGLLVLLHTSKKPEESADREINLSTVTVDTYKDENAPLEERLFSRLMKASLELNGPWAGDLEVARLSYDDDGDITFEIAGADATYEIKMTKEGLIYQIAKAGELDHWDQEFIEAYGGNWGTSSNGIWNIKTLNISTYVPYDINKKETEVELKPMSANTTVDVSNIEESDIWNEDITDDQRAYAYSYYIIDFNNAPWKGKSYTKELVNAEDGVVEILLSTDDASYRLRVDRGGNLYKYYKDKEFTDEDYTFLNTIGGTWKETGMIDIWYVMDNVTYVLDES